MQNDVCTRPVLLLTFNVCLLRSFHDRFPGETRLVSSLSDPLSPPVLEENLWGLVDRGLVTCMI